MKVRLKFRTIDELPREMIAALHDVPRLKAIGFTGDFAPIGMEFIVYGIDFVDGNILYRLGDPPEESFVILCLGALFEIIDARVSRHWKARVLSPRKFVLWPPSWFTEFYFDRLSDGDPELTEDFTRVKRLMKAESEATPSLVSPDLSGE